MGYLQGIYVNDSGTWRQMKKLYVNDSGTWRDIQRAYVNDGGTWRKIWEFNSGTSGSPLTTGSEKTSGSIGFWSRDGAAANCQGWFKFDATNGWMTRSYCYQASGGFSNNTGWVTGGSCGTANQTTAKMCIPGKNSTFHTPILECNGNHYGYDWNSLWDWSGQLPGADSMDNNLPTGWVGPERGCGCS